MSDWLDGLAPHDRADWDSFVDHTRREALYKIERSAFVASIVPGPDQTDIKFAVELGLAIMLDKPIMAIVPPGRKVPRKLASVLDELVFADVDTEVGRRKIAKAMNRMTRRLAR